MSAAAIGLARPRDDAPRGRAGAAGPERAPPVELMPRAAAALLDPPPRRIAVLRALALGDLLCALPALRSLRAAVPRATITLVGLPWAREFVARQRDVLDEFIEFPGHPAFPERVVDEAARAGFDARMRALGFDLAVQMQGSGEVANDIVAAWGARHTAGFHPPEAPAPGPGFRPWPVTGHEIDRLLVLPRFLGAPDAGRGLTFPLDARDRAEAAALELPAFVGRLAREGRAAPTGEGAGPAAAPRGLVCVHPGARLPSRRWPAERFAQVAAALARDGWTVAVTGSAGEAEVARAVLAQARARLAASDCSPGAGHRLIDLVGRTSLGALGAVLDRAALLVSNDTGVAHIAAALRLPSVIVASGSEVARWAPLDARLHRVLWADADCRPCAHEICPVGHGCALAVTAEAVIDAARAACVRRHP